MHVRRKSPLTSDKMTDPRLVSEKGIALLKQSKKLQIANSLRPGVYFFKVTTIRTAYTGKRLPRNISMQEHRE